MTSVAQRIQEWLSLAGDACQVRSEIVDWASPFDDDDARAFRECRRADHLVVLAAVAGLDKTVLERVASDATGEVVGLAPEYGDVLTRMHRIATSWRRGAALPTVLPAELDAVTKRVRDAEDVRRVESFARDRALNDAWALVVARARQSVGEQASVNAREAAITHAITHALCSTRELGALVEMHQRRFAVSSALFAVKAMFGALHVAKVGDALRAEWALLRLAPRGPRSPARSTTSTDVLDHHLCGGAATLFQDVALAHGHARAASPEAWHVVARTFAESTARGAEAADALSAQGLALREYAAHEAESAIQHIIGQATAAKLAELADRLREAGLGRPAHVGKKPSASAMGSVASKRARIRRTLDGARAAARQLGDRSLDEALTTALMILDASGPLDPSFTSVLRTVHEHLAEALGEARPSAAATEAWRALLDRLERDIGSIAMWLRADRRGSPPS